tara:strand:+ start:460 stop:969 length:510 start_codon:yes stop_codon:yes gene_type:complete
MSLLMNQCSQFPSLSSSGDIWENWHKNLVKCVGTSRANDLFLQLWRKRAGANSEASTIQLRNYLSTQGVELTVNGLKKTQDFFSDTGEFFGAGLKTLGTGWKIMFYGLIGILVLGGAGLVYTIFVNPDKAARIGTAIATRGKSEVIGQGLSSKKLSGGKSPKMIGIKSN